MRCTLATIAILFATQGAEDAPAASGVLDGKRVAFPAKGVADGVKAAAGLLASCHDKSRFDADELKRARQGDHVRLVFPRPIAVEVMGARVEVSELLVRQPLNTGVIGVRAGGEWQRYAKYEFPKEAAFAAWLRQARPAD